MGGLMHLIKTIAILKKETALGNGVFLLRYLGFVYSASGPGCHDNREISREKPGLRQAPRSQATLSRVCRAFLRVSSVALSLPICHQLFLIYLYICIYVYVALNVSVSLFSPSFVSTHLCRIFFFPFLYYTSLS